MVEIDEAAVTIAGALEDAGVPYALGGALAYIVHAIPRATNDERVERLDALWARWGTASS